MLNYTCDFHLKEKPDKLSITYINNKLTIDKSVEQLLGQDITLLLNLENRYFNVYLGGILATSIQNGRYSFSDLPNDTTYTPFVSIQNIAVDISFQGNVILPLSPPGKQGVKYTSSLSAPGKRGVKYTSESSLRHSDCIINFFSNLFWSLH